MTDWFWCALLIIRTLRSEMLIGTTNVTSQKVPLLILIDSINPSYLPKRSETELDMIVTLIELFSGRKIPADLALTSKETQMAKLMESMHLNHLPSHHQANLFELMKLHWQALCQYQPESYTGNVLFFEAQEKSPSLENISIGSTWKDLIPSIDIHITSGNHLSMIL